MHGLLEDFKVVGYGGVSGMKMCRNNIAASLCELVELFGIGNQFQGDREVELTDLVGSNSQGLRDRGAVWQELSA